MFNPQLCIRNCRTVNKNLSKNFNYQGDGKPHETILLKNVVQYTAVGSMCNRLPVRRPSFPLGVSDHAVNRLICIGMDPQASKAHWILFPSERILELIF